MDGDQFKQSFSYNFSANDTLFRQYLSLPSLQAKPASIISHILVAQEIWCNRIQNSAGSGLKPWDPVAPGKWLDLNQASFDRLRDITNVMDPDSTISYTNSKGKPFTSSVRDILHHLLLHGSYHRGQLALLLRQYGEDPPATDYIFFIRE